MAAFLIVQRGEDIGRRFDLDTTQLTVGRGSDNDMVLNDPMVSRYHAVVKRQGNGYLVIDLGSSNPVVINDQVCDPGEPRVLQHRDVVFIGKTVFSFQSRGIGGNTGAGTRPQAIDRTTVGVQLGSSPAESDSPTPPPPSRQPSSPAASSARAQEERAASAPPKTEPNTAPSLPTAPPPSAEQEQVDDKTMVAGVVRSPESGFAPFSPPPPPSPSPGMRSSDDDSTRPTPGLPAPGGNTPPPPPPFAPPRPGGAGAPPPGGPTDEGDGDMPTQIVPRRP